MKNNVINSQFAIDVHSTDSLEIIGRSRSAVVFKLTGTSAGELLGSHPAFCKNAICTHDIVSSSNVLIFEYNLKEELRNPRKLLKSVRNKLVQAGFRNMKEQELTFREMYEPTDRQEHQMFEARDRDREYERQRCSRCGEHSSSCQCGEPLPQVCL